MWLSLGGFPELTDGDPPKIYSNHLFLNLIDTHILINHEGNIVSRYRKLHLFDVDLSYKVIIQILIIEGRRKHIDLRK